jgi:uncharacterized protein
MLRSFVVINYRSFRDQAELSMTAAKIKSVNKALDTDNVFQIGSHSLLRSAVIYGANASGKSNIIKAIRHMRSMVLSFSSQRNPGESLGQPFKLNVQSLDQPTSFEVEFFVQNTKYRYGFEVKDNTILSEWLYHTPNKREVMLFVRKENTLEQLSSAFKKEAAGLMEKTRADTLLVSVVDQFNGQFSSQVVEWFKSIIILTKDHIEHAKISQGKISVKDYKDSIARFLSVFDTGISGIKISGLSELDAQIDPTGKLSQDIRSVMKNPLEPISANGFKKAYATHTLYDGNDDIGTTDFDFQKEESDGTQKMFAFANPITDALKMGRPIFVDEFDSTLHTLIVQRIIKLFNNPEVNLNNSQLILTTHDTNLLQAESLRRDQIWFIEKTTRGESSLCSLVEYRIRNDVDFEKKYLTGRFSAVPWINELELEDYLQKNYAQNHLHQSIPRQAENAQV